MTEDLPPPVDQPSWKIRRTVVFITLIYCATMILYLALWGPDDDLRATIANGVLFLAGSVIMGYIFGVVWHDKNFLSGGGRSNPYLPGSDPYGRDFHNARDDIRNDIYGEG